MTTADVAAITGAVDFSTIGVGIGVIAAAVAVIYVGVKGAKMLLQFVRS